MYEDIYFLNSQEALRVATEQNRWEAGYKLQVCYYDGEKIESDLPNLFHLPIDNLLEGLVYGIHRVPTKIDFTGLDISAQVKMEVMTHFNITMQQVEEYRIQFNAQYLQVLKSAKLDFSEPLRFFLMGNSQTKVMQFVSKNLAETLEDMGYKVLFQLFKGTEDIRSLKTIYEFNPHATISINHLNNKYLGEDVFNFVWFQDPMDVITNNEAIYIRKRDYVFHLIQGLGVYLKNKGINSTLQPFMISQKEYKPRADVKKEKKIVFIGSSYQVKLDELKSDGNFGAVYTEAVELFEKNSCFKSLKHENSEIRYLMEKYHKSEKYIGNIYAYLSRDYCIEKLCGLQTDYGVEVYGYGWENNEVIKPFFKGQVQYGEDISKIYNSATYGFCPGPYVMMQRTLECAFSGSIPLVLDVRRDMQDDYDVKLEEGIEFFRIDELENLLQKETPQNREYPLLREEYGYSHFVNKILNIIDTELSKS